MILNKILLLVLIVSLFVVTGCKSKELEQKVEQQQKQLVQKDQELEKLRTQVQELTSSVDNKDKEVAATNTAIAVVVKERDACLQNASEAGASSKALQEELKKYKKELRSWKKEADEQKTQNKRLAKVVEGLKKKLKAQAPAK